MFAYFRVWRPHIGPFETRTWWNMHHPASWVAKLLKMGHFIDFLGWATFAGFAPTEAIGRCTTTIGRRSGVGSWTVHFCILQGLKNLYRPFRFLNMLEHALNWSKVHGTLKNHQNWRIFSRKTVQNPGLAHFWAQNKIFLALWFFGQNRLPNVPKCSWGMPKGVQRHRKWFGAIWWKNKFLAKKVAKRLPKIGYWNNTGCDYHP